MAQSRLARVVVAAVLAVMIVAHPAVAAESPTAGRGERVAGRDLTTWEVAWTRWLFRMPYRSFSSSQCLPQAGDSAAVWFLAGGSGGYDDRHVVEVHCTVPAGRYLLLGVPSLVCSDRPGVRRGRAASVGRAAMLRPLPPGSHTLISGVRYRITHNIVVVYKLDVV